MTPYQHRLAAQLTCMEALKSGCTTLCEFFYTDQNPQLADGCIAGMEDTGIRSVFIRTFQDTGEDYGMPECTVEPAEQAMDEVSRLRRDYADRGDMLSIWTGPDVTWSTTREGYRTMLEYCLSENVRYAMHIDETEVDNAMCRERYGRDIVLMLDDMGFLTDKMLGVHCVNLTDDEIRRFADHGVSVSYNLVSNIYLGSGAAPIRECLDAGVNVSVGTDGAASNNTTNYLKASNLRRSSRRASAGMPRGSRQSRPPPWRPTAGQRPSVWRTGSAASKSASAQTWCCSNPGISRPSRCTTHTRPSYIPRPRKISPRPSSTATWCTATEASRAESTSVTWRRQSKQNWTNCVDSLQATECCQLHIEISNTTKYLPKITPSIIIQEHNHDSTTQPAFYCWGKRQDSSRKITDSWSLARTVNGPLHHAVDSRRHDRIEGW